MKKKKVTPVPESLKHGTQQYKHSLSSHVYPGVETGISRVCQIFNQVGLDVLAACLNMIPTSSLTGTLAPSQRSNTVKHFQSTETGAPRPKNLVTEGGFGSHGEVGASQGSSKLVSEKHRLEEWRVLCSFSL